MQTQLLQRLVERPGAIRVLAGLQGKGDGLGSLISYDVVCSSSVRAALSVIMLLRQKGRSEQKREGTAGLTAQIQLLKLPNERPGAIRVLAGLQGRGDGLGSLSSNAVLCSSVRAALSVIMLHRQKGRSEQ